MTVEELMEQLQKVGNKNKRVAILSDNNIQVIKIDSIITDKDIDAVYIKMSD
jgi:hypothetical protein